MRQFQALCVSIGLAFFASCGEPDPRPPMYIGGHAYAEKYDFSPHVDKTIERIGVNDYRGSRNVTLYFTDGSALTFLANKYVLNVHAAGAPTDGSQVREGESGPEPPAD